MIRIFLQIIKTIFVIFIFNSAFANDIDTCGYLFDTHGQATQNLADLLDATKILIHGPRDIYNITNSLDIEKWHNHPGIERWYLTLEDNLKSSATNIIDICENELHMKDAILPKYIKYSGILFLGSTLNSVVRRADFYNALIEEKIIDKKLKIWVLTGERNLDKNAGETKENFLKLVAPGQKVLPLPTNELDMIKFVFYYKMPKNTEIEYVYSEKEINHTRATTASTIYAWSEKMPETRSKIYYLGISNQPYVIYQESIINLTLQKIGRKNVEVDVSGPRAQSQKDNNNYAATLLDAVSKTISNCHGWFLLDTNNGLKNSVEL